MIMATNEEVIVELMHKPELIRNIGIAAHIDHGKTTLSDNLVAGAGMMSEELAGQQLFTDFDEQEQERGITIFSANVSMVHDFKGQNHLINLIDTPGHVDFGGDVTRAMRAVDGAVILTDAVEGVMPQTETVIRQALHERVKPVLFINKVDRLIKELQLTPEQMQEKFVKIIAHVNMLIDKYAEPEFAEKWHVKVEDGSVAFGSAYRKWAMSVPFMESTKMGFREIIDSCSQGKDEELAKKAPLHKIVLNMVIKHLPNPQDAQKYRIQKIWKGDIDSQEGKDMMALNSDGNLAAIITKINADPHAGYVATARIFSGTIKKGEEIYLVGQHKVERLQQVSIYKGPQRVQMNEIPAGNIVGLVGLNEAFSGETVSTKEMHPFESIKHIFEPVVTKSLECENPSDLPKLISFLRNATKEDPTLVSNINEETGETLVSGLGELHIDAKIERPLKEKGIATKTSLPIVIYRETVRGASPEVEEKSPNKHNRFMVSVESMESEVYKKLSSGEVDDTMLKKNLKGAIPILVEAGMSRDQAKKIKASANKNLFIDGSKGVQYLNESIKLVTEAFENVMSAGPMAGEPCSEINVFLTDAKLHEDNIHRGPAQVIPTVAQAIKKAMMQAKPTLLEPLQILRIDVPEEQLSNVMTLVQNRRGQVLDTTIDQGTAAVQVKIPVSETFGMEAVLKSNTEGKGFYSLIEVTYEKMPEELKDEVIRKIRQRKGMADTQ
jgi:elongation factor 2